MWCEKWRQIAVLAVVALAVPLSFIGAPYPKELLLQHFATVLGLVGLTGLVLLATPSWISFVCLTLFLVFHIIGARWIYSFVPYDQWWQSLTGWSLSEALGWERNHYDRLVHFASGALGVPPAAEYLRRGGGMGPYGAALMGIASVLAVGAVYEIFEWQIAVWMSPDQAEAYNGQQGDVWDPQKDLAMAWLGATVSAIWVGWRGRGAG